MNLRNLALTLCVAVPALSNAVVILNFNTPISGQPVANGDQLIARLTVSNASVNVVNATFQHFGSSDGSRFIGDLYLNIAPYKTVSLVGAPTSPISSVSSSQNGIGGPGNQYKWDLLVDFAQGPPNTRMHQGRTINFQLTGMGLTETDFLSKASTTPSHSDQLYGLFHLQGINNTPGVGSTWYGAVPEPATMIALGIGLAAVSARRRKS